MSNSKNLVKKREGKSAFLTILIPTYNRAGKLHRLLKNIQDEAKHSMIAGQVDVIVSDNASTDSTSEILSSFIPTNFRLRFFRQNENLGIDGNMLFLYKQAVSTYIWYFADDDILLPGAIEKVVDSLKVHTPDALLFSFRQPPDSKDRTFDFHNPVEVIEHPVHIIKLLTKFPKISIYLLRNEQIKSNDYHMLSSFIGTGFLWLPLVFSVLSILSKKHSPKLCILSQPLASCDSGYRHIRLPPETWGCMWKIFTHPYVRRYAPDLAHDERRKSYYSLIGFLFNYKTGILKVDDPAVYNKYIRKMVIRIPWLIRNFRAMIQLFLLKLGLAKYWPLMKKITWAI